MRNYKWITGWLTENYGLAQDQLEPAAGGTHKTQTYLN